ncbi:MAG TPA: hypothetical protein VFA10_17720 [Ktedonobacteraceae bacterium]|nr:hypothetical protein [Ktedonobacteraceae bacterium]
MSAKHVSAVPAEPEQGTETAPQESVPDGVNVLASLLEEVKALRADVEALKSMAHNQHSIDPEVIDSIAKVAVGQMTSHLQTVLEMGNTLLKK